MLKYCPPALQSNRSTVISYQQCLSFFFCNSLSLSAPIFHSQRQRTKPHDARIELFVIRIKDTRPPLSVPGFYLFIYLILLTPPHLSPSRSAFSRRNIKLIPWQATDRDT